MDGHEDTSIRQILPEVVEETHKKRKRAETNRHWKQIGKQTNDSSRSPKQDGSGNIKSSTDKNRTRT
jgi:hypothetical protein